MLIEHIKPTQLHQGECLVSYDVKALFTSVPVDLTISIIKNKLQQDPYFIRELPCSSNKQTHYWSFASKNTYFLFQGKYFEEAHGAAMGPPLALSLPT